MNGCGRKIGRYRTTECGVDGLCSTCWQDEQDSNIRARLVTAEKVVEAAQAFIDTMARHHSSIAGKEVVSGFTKYSGDAARELAAALEARVDS